MDFELTVAQAAEELGISVSGIHNRIRRGEMKARRVNARLLLIPREEVQRWKELGRLAPGPKRTRDQSQSDHH